MINQYRGSKNYCTLVQPQGEMADEVEASCQPPASRDKKLGPSFVRKRIKIEDGVLKRFCVESDTISNCSKFGDCDAVRSNSFLIMQFAM